MPTIANTRLPTPKSWEEFEDICRDAFGERWRNPNLVKHGRPGQEQHGVDVCGHDASARQVGIQCKNTVGNIKAATVDSEIALAEGFTPSLDHLYIATTCATDAHIQRYVRSLSKTRMQGGKFGVEIVFWDEIVQDLSRNEVLARKHYPQFFLGYFPGAASPHEMQRAIDERSLKSLLSVIDVEAVDDHLQMGAKYVHVSVQEHLGRIREVLGGPTFAIRDPQLAAVIDRLVEMWTELIVLMDRAPYEFLDHRNLLRFTMPGDFCRTTEEHTLFEQIGAQMREVRLAIRALCRYVLDNHMPIDFNATNSAAARLYLP